MDIIPTNLPIRPDTVIVRDRYLNEQSQKNQMEDFQRTLRKQGSWMCLGGCGQRISANATHCKACAEKLPVEGEQQ